MKEYGTIQRSDGKWRISTEPHVFIRLKRLFPRLSKRKGTAKINDTLEVCKDLSWFLGRYPMGMSPEDLQYLEDRASSYDEKNEYFTKLTTGSKPRDFELALPAREYQKVAADLALKMGSLLLADDMGLGKTCSAICMLTDPDTLPAVVVTLTSLPFQWQREINKFIPNARVHVAKKGKPDVPKDQEFDVYVLTYSKIAGWADMLAGQVKTVIYDEVQELRRNGSSKYSAAETLSSKAKYIMGLSGTPIYNYGQEFFNVVSVIRPDSLGDRYEFLREWCTGAYNPDKARIHDPVAFGSYLREQCLLLRRNRSDVKRELLPLTRIEHNVDCDPAELDKVKSSVSELAKFILSQEGSGFDKMKAGGDLDWRMRQATGIAKAPYVAAFVDMIIESGEKVLLYGWHHTVYDIWMDRLKRHNPVMYTGKESLVQKEKAKEAFCTGDSKVLIMSLRAGAGLDGLQHYCRTVVFGELDWSSGVHNQCEDRVNRDGQEDPVIVYYPTSDEGSDPIMIDVLGVKKAQLGGVINPDQDLIEKLSGRELDGIKRLAESVLSRG